jgi:hypothetical protein
MNMNTGCERRQENRGSFNPSAGWRINVPPVACPVIKVLGWLHMTGAGRLQVLCRNQRMSLLIRAIEESNHLGVHLRYARTRRLVQLLDVSV